MAAGAGIRNLILIGHFGRDEGERVAPNIDIRNGLLDLRHVAGHAIIAGAAGLMMRMCFDARSVRPVR